jgi:hypothetical protein
MKRVHDFTLPETASSPETSPVAGRSSKKKDKSGRKKKDSCPSGTQTIKKTRATGLEVPQSQSHNGQQLEHAETKYYSCKSRVQDVINNLNPQDPTAHDRANAGLQEIAALGLSYRCIRAGAQLPNTLSSVYNRPPQNTRKAESPAIRIIDSTPALQNPTDGCLVCMNCLDVDGEDVFYYTCKECSHSFHKSRLELSAENLRRYLPYKCPYWQVFRCCLIEFGIANSQHQSRS